MTSVLIDEGEALARQVEIEAAVDHFLQAEEYDPSRDFDLQARDRSSRRSDWQWLVSEGLGVEMRWAKCQEKISGAVTGCGGSVWR